VIAARWTTETGSGALLVQNGTVVKNGAGVVGILPALFTTTFATGPTIVQINGGTLQVGGGTDTNTIYQGVGGLTFASGTRALNGSTQIVTTGGPVNFTGATVTFASGATYNPAGTTNVSAGTVNFNMPLLTLNTPTNISGGVVNAAGSVVDNNLLTLASGAQLSAPGQVVSVSAAGTLDLNGGSMTAGNLSIAGLLKGNGTVNGNVSNSGTVAPGASPGTINIVGNYTQSPTGVLQLEIGGTSPGAGHDQLVISGNASLDGTLLISQFGSFAPGLLDRFQAITTGGTVSGAFASVVVPAVFTGLGVSYQSQGVEVASAPGSGIISGISSSIPALDPGIVREDKNIFVQADEDKDIFKKSGDFLMCN